MLNGSVPVQHEALKILRANIWLKDLPAGVLAELAALARYRKYTEGQLIAAKDTRPEGICIIISGGIRSSTFSETGKEIVFSLVRAGSLWGVVAALDGNGSVHDTRASGNTELLVIPDDALLRLMDREPALYRHFSRMLCYRLRKAYSAVDDLGLATLRQRLARRLCALGMPSDAHSAAPGTALNLTQENLAVLVGATRSSVNRELRALQREGLVEVGYRTVAILDYARLQELCASRRIFDL
jgi:CRP-like cAMP-binding protein